MAHAQKPDFVFRRNGQVHLNRRGRQFSRLLAAEVCASAVVMLDTPHSDVVWWVLATHSICQFPLQFPSRASLCAITFQLDSTSVVPRDVHYASLCTNSMEWRASWLSIQVLSWSENCSLMKFKFSFRCLKNPSICFYPDSNILLKSSPFPL
jgi:hypothetical protein